MNATVTATSKRRPTKIGASIPVRMRWPLTIIDEIDQWAAAQPDKPSCTEAILRLVQQALASATYKAPQNQPTSLIDVLKAASAVPSAARPLPALPPPQRDTERIGAKVDRTTREPRWKPRLVEAGRTLAEPKAHSLAKPTEEGNSYEMPEDIIAFNEYWKLAELMLHRPLQYKEVIVAYNRYNGERRGPVLPLTDRDVE
jgi:hypothetical protein